MSEVILSMGSKIGYTTEYVENLCAQAQAEIDDLKTRAEEAETEARELAAEVTRLRTEVVAADAATPPCDRGCVAAGVADQECSRHGLSPRALHDELLGVHAALSEAVARAEGAEEALADVLTERNAARAELAGETRRAEAWQRAVKACEIVLSAMASEKDAAVAEVEQLREWKRLHSADVLSVRTEQAEVEEQRDDAEATLARVREVVARIRSHGNYELPESGASRHWAGQLVAALGEETVSSGQKPDARTTDTRSTPAASGDPDPVPAPIPDTPDPEAPATQSPTTRPGILGRSGALSGTTTSGPSAPSTAETTTTQACTDDNARIGQGPVVTSPDTDLTPVATSVGSCEQTTPPISQWMAVCPDCAGQGEACAACDGTGSISTSADYPPGPLSAPGLQSAAHTLQLLAGQHYADPHRVTDLDRAHRIVCERLVSLLDAGSDR